jgi:hypothetical protein
LDNWNTALQYLKDCLKRQINCPTIYTRDGYLVPGTDYPSIWSGKLLEPYAAPEKGFKIVDFEYLLAQLASKIIKDFDSYDKKWIPGNRSDSISYISESLLTNIIFTHEGVSAVLHINFLLLLVRCRESFPMAYSIISTKELREVDPEFSLEDSVLRQLLRKYSRVTSDIIMGEANKKKYSLFFGDCNDQEVNSNKDKHKREGGEGGHDILEIAGQLEDEQDKEEEKDEEEEENKEEEEEEEEEQEEEQEVEQQQQQQQQQQQEGDETEEGDKESGEEKKKEEETSFFKIQARNLRNIFWS